MTRRILTSLKGVTVDDVTSRDRLRQIRDGVDSVNNKIVTLMKIVSTCRLEFLCTKFLASLNDLKIRTIVMKVTCAYIIDITLPILSFEQWSIFIISHQHLVFVFKRGFKY